MKYVVASSRDWFQKLDKSENYKSLDVIEISNKEDLTIEFLEEIQPRYIFFPHWNWIVPEKIFNNYECVVFHTAPLPYGRGGSPIQNLILNGYNKSPVNALRMTDCLDGGPIYNSLEISLEGTIDQIFEKIAVVTEKLILSVISAEPIPKEQEGKIVTFKRLKREDNKLPLDVNANELFDRIRMVDGKDYPKAFIEHGPYTLEFFDAELCNSKLTAKVNIILKKTYWKVYSKIG